MPTVIPKVIFGPPNSITSGWLERFDHPVEIHSTSNHADIIPMLRGLDDRARDGLWVVLLLSYEAAAAFDSALQANPPSEFPLLWAAVFERPSVVETRETYLPFSQSDWQPEVSHGDYSLAVARIRELIAAGDTYQVNYTFPLRATFTGDPLSWYRELCKAQTANYCAYLELGRFTVLSLSPELFFERKGNQVITRPMKGTINRGRWRSEDQKMANTLLTSTKDRAENVMIVDLLRNDLGRVSIPGSVQVSSLFDLERYETLWQMTSTVTSELQPKVGVTDLLAALFPCGSITGAPKIRTMEIIKELEPGPRGVYCGTIGLIKPGGDCVFNVAIRTLVLDHETNDVRYGVGGGITYDSTADREYEECLLKSSFLDRRVPEFQLLETMRAENGAVFLLERHLARLKSSANYFGFAIDVEHVRAEIEKLASGDKVLGKLRVLVDKEGNVTGEVSALPNPKLPLRVGLAAEPVNSSDVFLFHKTTHRAVYENAMRGRDDVEDVILWNERGEITESTIANVAVLIDGKWFTPSRKCGLLAGVFREELLAKGAISERVISIAELKAADEVRLLNSVRKWMPAKLGQD